MDLLKNIALFLFITLSGYIIAYWLKMAFN